VILVRPVVQLRDRSTKMRIAETTAGTPRWALAMGSLVSVAALTACGSVSSSPSTPAATSAGNSSAPTSVTATGPLTSAELAVKLEVGSRSVSSAHITLSSTVGDQRVLVAHGDETLAAGKLTAMNLNEQVGALNMTLLLVDGGVYVKLPSNLNTSGKPWEKATTGSRNPVLRQLASSIASVEQSASLTQYESLTQAATSLKTIGAEQVNGTAATHYSLIVDVTKIRGAGVTEAGKAALAQAGITKIPEDLWVDEKGHPVKVWERFTIRGQVVSTVFTISQLNQPVTISAPPASQVSISPPASQLLPS
jgi:hypothetical protein